MAPDKKDGEHLAETFDLTMKCHKNKNETLFFLRCFRYFHFVLLFAVVVQTIV